ncbi:MAG: hypothetical protein FWG87_01025 [Defluviitaleaceae bacterium]|nr:hypothetical protein [Defluviitaleaceae bacterium]
MADFKGMERGFSRIWRIYADSIWRVFFNPLNLRFVACCATLPLLCASVRTPV